MKNDTSSVGDIIDARCTKCASVTNHMIVSKLGTKPFNVQCNTCNATHRYRATASTPKTARQPGISPPIKPEDWEELRAAAKNGLAKDYDMEKEYRVGTLIRHSCFGFGLVQRVFGNRKMEVLFDDGRKTMRCK